MIAGRSGVRGMQAIQIGLRSMAAQYDRLPRGKVEEGK
jgi:hypothetical protein